MVKRQVPKPSEIVELMQFRKPSLDFRANRLSRAQSIADLRRIAKRRTPAAAFDCTDGSADREISLARARKAFEDVELHPGYRSHCPPWGPRRSRTSAPPRRTGASGTSSM